MSEGSDIEDTPGEGSGGGEASPKGRSRASRVARRTTLQLGVVLLVLLGATQTSFFRDAVREQLVPTINESLDGRLKVGGLEGSLLGGLELTDVEVYDARDNLVVRLDRATASYSLFELTSRRLALDVVEGTGGLVVVRAYPDGELNVGLIAKPSDEPPAEGPSAVSVHIGSLTLRDAHVLYVDERAPAEDAPELPEGLAALAARLDGAVEGEVAEVAGAWAADASALSERPQVGAPRAAALLGVEVELDLDLSRAGDLEVRVSALSATARADTMVGAVGVEVEGVEAGLYSDAVTVASARGRLAGASLWEGLEAGVGYGPEREGARPIESLYVNADVLGVTRAQLDAAAPGTGVLAGFSGRLRAGGLVGDVRAHLEGRFEGGAGEVALGGRARGVLDALLAEGGEGADAGLGEGSSYEAYLIARGLDVSSVVDVGTKVRLSARAGVKGSGFALEELDVAGDLRVYDAVMGQAELESFEAEVGFAQGKAAVDRAVLRTPYMDAEARGWATLGGEFDVSLDARTEARHAGQVLVGLEGEEPIEVPQDATLGVKAKGSLDLEHTEDPVVMTRELDVKGGWSIAGFEGAGVEVADSTGEVDVQVRTPEPGARTWRYDVDARVRRLRAPGVIGDRVRLDVDGDTRVTAPLSNPLKLLKKLRSDTKVEAARFEGFGVTLNSATMRAVTRPGGLGLGYEVDAEVGETSVRSGGVRARLSGAKVDLGGAVSLDTEARSTARMLRALGVAGTASAQGLSAPGLARARSASATLDVKGPIDALHGKASVDVRSGEASGVPFERVEASVGLTPKRGFTWGVDVSRERDEYPGRVVLDGKGVLPASLDRLVVDEMKLKVDDGNVWRVARASVDASARGVVRFEEVELRNARQQIRLHGVYRARGEQDLTASLKSVDLARVRQDFGLAGLIAPLKGKVPDLTVTLKGTEREPQIDVKGGVEGVSYDGIGPVTLNTWARYRTGRLTLTSFDLDGLGHEHLVDAQGMVPMRFDLSGNVEVFWTRPLLATATVHPIDLSDVARAVPALGVEGLDGTISGTLVASGTLEEPTVDSKLHGYEVEVKREFGEQTVDVSGVDVDVTFAYAPPRGKEGGLDTDVKVRWEGAERVSLDLVTPLPFAKWIYDVVERGEEIDFAAQTLAQPYALDVQVKGLDLRKVDVRPLLSGPDAAGVLHAEVKGEGRFDDPVFDFGVRMGEMQGGSPFACGDMTGDAWKAPRRREGKSVEGFGWGRFRDILFRLNGSVRGGKLKLDCLKVNWDRDDIVTAVGEVPLPMNVLYEGAELEDLPIDFDIVLHDNELRKLSAIDYDTFAALVGKVRGEIEATGSLKRPQVDGVLEVVDTNLGVGQVGTVRLEVGARDDVARTRGWLKLAGQDDALEVLGFGALARVNLDLLGLADGADPLAVSARPARVIEGGGKRGELTEGDDFRVVVATAGEEPVRLEEIFPEAYFASEIKGLKGDVRIDMDLSGTYERPKPRGELVVSGVEATVLSLGRKFEDVAARVKLDDEALTLEGFEVKEGKGELGMEARLAHERLRPGALKATMRSERFDLGSFADFPAFVTSVVDVTGEMGATPPNVGVEISGLDVRLPDDLGGDLHPTELDEDIVIVRRSKDEDALRIVKGIDVDVFEEDEASRGGFEMDMKITFADGSMLYHPYGFVAFNGEMDVALEKGETKVVGEIVGERGDVEFLDKRFTLQNALVTFTGPATTPQLQIDAVYFIDRSVAEQLDEPRDGKARVVIRIDGTPSDPKLKLISDPSLTDTEILYILATGRPPQTAEVGQDQGVVSAALGAASGLALAMLQDSLSIKIPLDVIRLEGGTGGQAIGGFEVGKYLTPDLFVSYRQRFSSSEQASESILGIEYQFASKWKFETTLSTNSAASFNIFRDLL